MKEILKLSCDLHIPSVQIKQACKYDFVPLFTYIYQLILHTEHTEQYTHAAIDGQ